MTRRVPLLINRLVDRERQRRYRGIKRRMLGCEPLEGRALLVAQMLLPTWDADSLLPASPELRPYVPQEIVVALRNEGSSGGLQPALRDENTLATNLDSLFLDFDELLRLPNEDGGATTIATLRLGEGLDVPTALERLRSISGILWAAPNYIYGGDDPRELVPNDPQYTSQYHHPLMNNDRAWDVTRGESNIIVAITDDGVSLSHEDLAANIWINDDETAGDGVDNDNNGYVDDVHGWDFSSGDNDPNPVGTDSHGTHVSGIVAARLDNGLGVAGTAGGATIMPLRFYGSGAWTSTVIAAAYAYAVDNGARIVSTSYNVDGFVGDPTFLAGLQYLYDHGGLHFNSAGNNSQLNPPRQTFEQSLLVASTDATDARSGFSNYGTGIDVAAPGSGIFATLPNNQYGAMSGTSMATPNAAAVAALIWSAHPTWTRDQVAAQLLATADNIDAVNPSYVGLLGAGRVNSYRAVTETLPPPTVTSVEGLPANGASTGSTSDSFTIRVDQLLAAATADDASNYELREAGGDGVFGTSDDYLYGLSRPTRYFVGTNGVTLRIAEGALGLGKYRLTAGSGLKNPFGAALDGNADGAGGDAYVHEFLIGMPPLIPVEPWGSLVLASNGFGSIASAGDTDEIRLDLMAGQSLSVAVQPSNALRPEITVQGPSAFHRLQAASANGEAALLQSLLLTENGTYRITTRGINATTGTYGISVALNAAMESEGRLSTSNDSPATAEDLAGSFLPLTGTAERSAVLFGSPIPLTLAVEDFVQTTLAPAWTTQSSTTTGRIRVTGAHGTASGSHALLMDSSPLGATLNEAIWRVDVIGTGKAVLRFSHAAWNDELNTFAGDFVGSYHADGVAISMDGDRWHPVFTPPASMPAGQWQTFEVDLTAAAAAAGLELGAGLRIKFQQYDDYPISTDGRGYDAITLFDERPSDWYRFALLDGQSASVVAHASEAGANIRLELWDANSQLLSVGAGTNSTEVSISNFVDRTTDLAPNSYFVRAQGLGESSLLLVTRNADFDREPNSRLVDAQLLIGNGVVLGYLNGLAGSDPPGAAEAYGPRLPVPADAIDRGHSAAWPVGDELPEDDVVEGVDGRLIIKFRADESREHVRSRVESAGFEWVGDLAFVGAAVIRASGASTVSAALEFWRQQPDVVYVEPDYPLYSMATIPNDPQFNGLYGLHNLGQSGGQVDADIDAPEAWDVFRGSSEVVVAVIDTGVDYRHVDLAANMWRNPGEIAADGIDNDRNGYVDDIYGIDSYNNDSDPWDDQGHGTHVAGTIAAVGNNGVGVTGVNWTARVMALKFLGASGGATSGAISALEYLTVMKTRYGVNVVASNNSWGGGGYSRALHDAIQTSVDAGIPFVAAAGNAGANNDKGTFYPANYDVAGIITVAATDRNDRLASFSNYGATSVDLAAPGVSTLSTTPNNTYGSMSGTSMATPHVTGVIALMAGYNPAASPLELKNALLDAVDPVAELTGRVVSGGRLNAASSLQRVGRGDIYSFEAAAGDIISLRTRTPDATSPAYPNMLDPMIELLDGSGVVLAADDNGDSDGRNAVITYTAHDSGTYYVRVDSVRHSGTYLLTLTGVSAADASPKVTGSSPRDGEVVGLTFPLTYTVDLSEGFHWPSVDASDLVVEGRPARSVRAVDGDTLEFAIDPVTNTGDGVYHVTLPANKLTDLQGRGNTAFAATFRSDTTGPRIVGITWNNTALDASRVVAAGSMVMEVEFDEDLKTPGPGVLRLVETGQGIDYVPHSVSYDASRRRLRAEFGNLPDSAYSLSLFSGDGLLEDLVGNDLDGEPNGPRSDRTTTGNGVAGGSYFLDFFTDAAVITLPPLQRLAPLGGMVSRTDARAAVSQAGDSEDLTVELEAGQTLSVTMTGAAGLEPRVEVITPLGQSLGVSQAAAGEMASLQTLRGNAAGVYRIRASAAGGTIGVYEIRAFVNAALEVTDSSDGRELPIGGSYLDLGRFAVVGRSESSSDVDEYTVDLTGRSGHSLDVVVFGDSRLTSATLLLLDTNGTSILATGTASPLGVRATNIDLAITDFTVPRDGVYTLRVANAPVGEYTLVATDNLRFELEPNSAASDTLRRISTSAPVIGSLPSPDLSSDVLYYPFDEGRGTATANMAVPGEGPRLATVVGHSLGGVGQFGHALVTRTGIANGVDTGWVTSLGGESWTISFWLDRRAIPNSSSASYLFGDATAGNFRAFINGAAGNGNILLRGPFTEVLLPGGAPLTGPVHVAWVHDSSEKKIHGYVNGALVTTVAQGSFSINGSGTFQIGSYAAQSLASGGLLDEFRVSRSALTANHVAALANAASRLDNYVVQLEAGQAVTLLTETPVLGQLYSLPQVDLELRVLDPSGNVVAADQDSAPDGHNALLGFYAASSGSYRVEVRATAGLGEYLVRMENGPRLLLQLDADSIREDAGNAALTATVSRNTDPSQPLVVNLASSNTSVLRIAGSVIIPAGKTSITVPVDVLDNALLDGTRTVTLLAAEANHLDASVPVIVTDYEQLTTAIAAEWIEDNDGTSATTAIVSRSNLDDLSLSLVVNLTSSHPVVRVPSSVTIPAGQSSVVFALDAVDDGIFDGVKLVTIAGTAAGYISVADTVIVRDPFGGSPGELDTTFDGDGKLTTGFGRGAEQAHSVIVQADGKIIVAGQYGTGEGARMTITRYLADGSLDAAFDGDGKVALKIGSGSYNYGYAVASQADGKLVVAGFSGGDFAVVRLNLGGSLDSSFDGDGQLITSLTSGTDSAYGLAIQADGKIIVGGEANGDFALVRYDANGALDTTFDTDGKVTTGIGASTDVIRGVALQPDGKIVVAGYTYNGANYDFVVARYRPDGSLDPSFDGDGIVVSPIGTAYDSAYGVVVQPDGKILVGGDSNGSFALARYNLDGSFDTTFDGDGKLTTLVNSTSYGRAIALQGDGKIVAMGYAWNGSNYDFAITRYFSNGTLDTTLDGDGKLLAPFGASVDDYAYGGVVYPDGRILAVGTSASDVAVARYTAAGTWDTTFDLDGKVTTLYGEGVDRAQALAIQPDGKIIAVGYAYNGVKNDFAIARYNIDGGLDATFDGDGRQITAFQTYTTDQAYAVVIQGDGNIVVGGYSNGDFALARYSRNGGLDTSFDGDGKVTTPIGAGTDYLQALALQTDGRIVAAGYSWNGSNYDIALARYNSNGSLDTTFDTDGKLTTAIGSGVDIANSVVIQADGKIVVGGYSQIGSNNVFTIVRYNANGSLDTSFDGDGIVTTSIGTSSLIRRVTLQTDNKIVVAGYSWAGYNTAFAVARYGENGALDTTFDGDGWVTMQPATSLGDAYDLAVQLDGKIVVAGSAWNGSYDFALVRFNSNGSLDASFDSDGKVTTPIGTGSDYATAVALQTNGRVVLAGYSDNGGQTDFALARYMGEGPGTLGIDDVTVEEDAGDSMIEVASAFADPNDPAESLVYSVSRNTNPPLFSAFEISQATGELKIDYAPNANGIAEVAVRATDPSGLYVDAYFKVRVNPVNDPPVVSAIADRTTNEDIGTGAIAFIASDPETPADNLKFTAESSNPDLAPASGVIFSGTGSNRNLSITPGVNRSGTAVITVTVNDGLATASTAFTLTVNSVNDPPAGTDYAVAIAEDAAYVFQPADFGISDPNDNPANVLKAVRITTLPVVGTLKLNGAAVVANDLVSKADLDTGKLSFTPVANAYGSGYASFMYQVQDDGGTANGGVDLDPTANRLKFDISPVGDTPQVASITTLEDTLSGAIVINRNANDGAEVTHFKLSGITGGTLFQNNGTTPISNGDFITFAQAQAGVKFLPSVNSNATGHFDVESSQDGSTVAAQSGKATSTITVTPVGDTPQVASVTTLEDTLSGPIVINRNAADGAEVTHFKLSGITGGTLFQNNGTTPINNGDFVTIAQAQAGVKFLPTANSTAAGRFDVESSQNGTTVAAQSGKATSTITITPVGDTPQVTNRTTLEDTLSGAIVINRHVTDATEVTHFKISGISAGTLFQNNGTTPINNGDFVTFAQAQAGVKFLPSANSNAAGRFDVESSQDGSTVAAQSGKATSTITVTPVGDTPQVANIATWEDTLGGAIVINRNANDGAEVTHFKLSGITGGTLFQNNGTTPIHNGDFITFAQAQAGVKFLPSANSNAAGHFDVESSQNGSTVAAQSGKAISTITVTPVGDTPQVDNSTTLEDTLSEAIVINRNPVDGAEVTHFKLSGIMGGTLFQNDGTTPINNGDFITFAQAQAGVKFLPSVNRNAAGRFDVESSQDGSTVAAQSGKATSTITIIPLGDTPQVASITTLEDTLSGPIVINRNAADGAEVTHFKFSGITGGALFQNNGTTPINNGDFITFAQAQAGVRFRPSANSTAAGHFDVESSQDGSTVAVQSGQATSTITVTPVGDTPLVDNSTTLEDTLSDSIVINRNAADGTEVTHFKVSGITGGTLFQNNGTTPINNGDFITFAQAQAGVRFRPSANSNAAGRFDVESSQNGMTVAAQSGKATSTITVTPVGDTPQVANITTLEDTLSGAIVISRNAVDGAEVTHFKLSGITGGTLFQNDGTTPINSGDFITFAQAQAGVKFLPSANSTAAGHFDVESSQDGSTVADQSGQATSNITVMPVGDTPQVTNLTTLEDTLSGAIVINRHLTDGTEVTHFKLSGITGGTLFQNNGTTPISNGDFITFAQAQAGVRFRPSANSNAAGRFDVESSQNGTTVAAQSGKATSTITVTPVGDTPQVANITTLEDTLSGAIVISRNAVDGAEVTHFKLSGITGGTLFQNDGTTPISNGDFITFTQAQAGVKFLPSANSNAAGRFDVESSQDGTTVAAQSGQATSTITVTPVGDTPQVANVTTLEDTLSGAIVINRHATDGTEVTHFKVSGITGGTLFQNNGTTPINNGDFITFAQAQAGVKFRPSANSNATGRFDVESSQDGTTVAAQSGQATSTIAVTPVGDTPQVASVTTLEDTLSGAIVINRHVTDGTEVTHFKVSGITGGTLFQNDGTTPINNGDFITFAQAQAGVKFRPSANSTAAGQFDVESSQDGSTVTAQSGKATSTITVTPVGDTPQVASITTLEDTLSGAIVINRNAVDGAEVTHFKLSGITGGTLFQNNGTTPINNGEFITFAQAQAGVRFLPSANSNAAGRFDVESSQDGTTVAVQSGQATSTITVTPVGDTPQVANLITLEDTLSEAIVINRNPADGAEVTHFKLSGITGGTLFQNNGTTPINNGDFITFAQAQAGVKFLPSVNRNAAGRFDVESSQDGSTVAAQSGKATSTITITPLGDTPQVASITTLEDTLSGPIVINRNAADGAEVTHFKLSGITGGALFQNNGTTPINNGDFITFAQAQAGVKFLPGTNSAAAGHFVVESSENGTTVAAQSGQATSTITVTPVGDTPQVANLTTLEDTLSGAIVINRNAADGAEVTHFKLSGITGGTLFQNDGTTPINNGDFMTLAQAQAGVRFLPSGNSNAAGQFDVEPSQDGSTVAAQSGHATSTITVTPMGDTPQVASITTLEDTLSEAIVINRNPADGSEVTHFKLSGIAGGTLFQNDGTTPISNGDFITFAQAQAGVRFLPSPNSTAAGHFDVESSQDGSTVAAQSGQATSTITVTPVNDPPSSLSLSANSVTENEAGATIGLITVTDPDAADSYSFTLSDNRFEIVASQLKSRTDEWLDFEAESSINLTITASDAGGLEVTKSFTIMVTNVNDAPTVIRVSTGAIRERIAGEAVGALSAVDQDAGQSHTFTIVSDARFEIVGSTLKLKADQFLELSDAASLSVDVSTTDNGTPPLTFSQTLLLNVVTNTHPWQNPTDSLNTNNDPAHAIAPIDALLIINLLNDPGTLLGPGSRLPAIRPANMPYFDTNGDNSATPLDALIVINFLNGMPSGEAESAIDVFSPRFNFNALPPTYTSQVFTLSNPPKTMDTVVTEPDACQIAHDSLSQSSNRGVRRALELENVLADIAADVVRARTYLGCELTNPDPTSSGNPTDR